MQVALMRNPRSFGKDWVFMLASVKYQVWLDDCSNDEPTGATNCWSVFPFALAVSLVKRFPELGWGE